VGENAAYPSKVSTKNFISGVFGRLCSIHSLASPISKHSAFADSRLTLIWLFLALAQACEPG
jgi:hypothetical protein